MRPRLHCGFGQPVSQGALGLHLRRGTWGKGPEPGSLGGKRDKPPISFGLGDPFWAKGPLEQGQLWATLRAAQAEVPPPHECGP